MTVSASTAVPDIADGVTGMINLDVTPFVQSLYNTSQYFAGFRADTIHLNPGFVYRVYSDLISDDFAAFRPQLSVTFHSPQSPVVPESTSLALAGFAMAAGAWRRLRQQKQAA